MFAYMNMSTPDECVVHNDTTKTLKFERRKKHDLNYDDLPSAWFP